jgi:hypothetical protein
MPDAWASDAFLLAAAFGMFMITLKVFIDG